MEKKQIASAFCLLLVTAVALGLAVAGAQTGGTEEPVSAPDQELEADEARQALRTYFNSRYSEAACSAIYTDLTWDGVEELLVLDIGADPAGEPVQLHGGSVPASCFADSRITVLQAEKGGTVSSIYEAACGIAPGDGVYLENRDGHVWLLLCTPEGAERCSLRDGARSPVPEEELSLKEAKPILVCAAETDPQSGSIYLDELFTTF